MLLFFQIIDRLQGRLIRVAITIGVSPQQFQRGSSRGAFHIDLALIIAIKASKW